MQARAEPSIPSEQLAEIARAARLSKRITRSAKVASFNCTVLWIVAVASLFGGLLNPIGYVLGLALAAVAWNEGRGARAVRELQLSGVRRLVWNQWLLAGVLVPYAAWKLLGTLDGESRLESQLADAGIDPSQVAIDFASLEQSIGIAMYGSMMVAVLASQAWLAWFHGKRRRMIIALQQECPGYAVDALRAAA